jgi:hypothetical protein
MRSQPSPPAIATLPPDSEDAASVPGMDTCDVKSTLGTALRRLVSIGADGIYILE